MGEEVVVKTAPVGLRFYGKFAWGIGLMPYDCSDFLNKNGIGFKLHLIFYAVKVVYFFKQ